MRGSSSRRPPYRVRPGADQGTPFPLDEPQAENPPTGAVLDYYLKEKQTDAVKLEIYDAAGKLVRRYSSTDEVQKINPDQIDIPMYWFPEEKPLSADAGMHRFVWDLRYAFAGARRRSRRGGGGPLAVPGRYTVKLTASGKTMSAPLIVKMDPRVKTSTADLERQFLLASKLAAGVGEFSAAAQKADDLQKQIAARTREASGNAELTAALDGLGKKVGDPGGIGSGRRLRILWIFRSGKGANDAETSIDGLRSVDGDGRKRGCSADGRRRSR